MSSPWAIPTVIHFACATRPAKILDVGVGLGAYGFLLRQYLDISNQRIRREDWKVQIDGVEVFEGYRNPVWEYAYDRVDICDVRSLAQLWDSYDVILCTDVLEHIERREVTPLVGRLLKSAKLLIATSPNVDYPQGAWGGNESETHLCRIDRTDFPELIIEKTIDVVNCYVCCADAGLTRELREAAYNCPVCRPEYWPHMFGRARQKLRRLTHPNT